MARDHSIGDELRVRRIIDADEHDDMRDARLGKHVAIEPSLDVLPPVTLWASTRFPEIP